MFHYKVDFQCSINNKIENAMLCITADNTDDLIQKLKSECESRGWKFIKIHQYIECKF